ncbi:5,6-dimethylbenzimidazole synthase [Rhodopila sp.]|uniref:5,6-dimethylbenzimidazole synthase n=1 Tax=Rhodopila sp. TaxID=2480087 RepID=UPI003D0E8D02
MAPSFDEAFQARLATLIAWRRDVRRFSDRPVPPSLIDDLLDTAQLSPSVGNSQPWRWVQVDSPVKRSEIRINFLASNAAACQAQPGERARTYASLKLAGIDRAPFQFAVFCDMATEQGSGLGRHSMPRMLEYSTVVMISTFWLAARAAGLGVGWVSILDPRTVSRLLDAPPSWELVAYLCVGWPETEHLDPELERHGWQSRTCAGRQVRIIK